MLTMTSRVIQGLFRGGQPKVAASMQPKVPPPIQTRTAGRQSDPPVPAFAARPPGPPAPAFGPRPEAVQRHGVGRAFAVEAGPLGLAASGGKPLPEAVRGKMEAALGADFSAVRVHVGPQAERIGAIAFTTGSDIYFAPGRYQPNTPHGQQLLGHELAHVVQQRAGRVKNPLGAGLAVVQDHALEAEADRLGRQAAMHRVAAQAKMVGAAQPSVPAARISVAIRCPERLGPAQPQRRTALIPPVRINGATGFVQRQGPTTGRRNPVTHTGQPHHPTQREASFSVNYRGTGAASGERLRLNFPNSGNVQARVSIPASRPSRQRIASTALPVPSPNRATGVVQGYVGLFKQGDGLFRPPWKLNGNKDKLMSADSYPHLTILLTHLNEYQISGDRMRGLSFNQFHYSESHDDPNRVTFIEASPGKWQPLQKGQNYENAKTAATELMKLIGDQLNDSVFDTWGKRRVASIRPDPEENQNVFPQHDLAYQ